MCIRVHVCVQLWFLYPYPPPPLLSFLSCVSANAEQLDAQVVGPLLLFQVLDFITNSVGGGSNVCGGVGGGVLLTSVGLFERVDEMSPCWVPPPGDHPIGGEIII